MGALNSIVDSLDHETRYGYAQEWFDVTYNPTQAESQIEWQRMLADTGAVNNRVNLIIKLPYFRDEVLPLLQAHGIR